jgi:NAD(P)-dependent dehydrogenase (short-subunit alcohol dehydrogenase family)
MEELRFDGRVAVVTGAGRGIGRAHALLLASRGAAVVVNDLGGDNFGSGSAKQPADDVVAEIVAAGGRAVANHASVAEEAGAHSMIDAALSAFGRIDILINNAGTYKPRAFDETDLGQCRRHIDVHALGTIMTAMAAWPHMVKQGYGRIVNTGSGSMYGVDKSTAYGAAKAAVLGFSLNLAIEAAAHGISVNCVFPGGATRLTPGLPTDIVDKLRPELVTPAVAYLAHESSILNGVVLNARGGHVAQIATFESKGYDNPNLTVEDVASRIDEILDLSGMTRFPQRNFQS